MATYSTPGLRTGAIDRAMSGRRLMVSAAVATGPATSRANAAPSKTHETTTDLEARLYRKGKQQAARLCYVGHVLTKDRHGLAVDVEMTQADGIAKWDAALTMLECSSLPRT